MIRAAWLAAGALALIAVVVVGAAAHFQVQAVQLARTFGDYVDGGARILPPPPPSSSSSEPGLEGDTDGMTRTDLEGDEVSPALATYGIDGDGNLFEVHSPHTEVPRLSGPTT